MSVDVTSTGSSLEPTMTHENKSPTKSRDKKFSGALSALTASMVVPIPEAATMEVMRRRTISVINKLRETESEADMFRTNAFESSVMGSSLPLGEYQSRYPKLLNLASMIFSSSSL